MPEIKFKHIVSFSSEDKVHKVENLLKPETYRKWKCASPGEKNATVVFQFEKASKIHSIDIGNEHSAFVEVLVTRSSDANNDYKVLLVASSFMSPLESRNGINVNRVRMFGPDKLSQNLKDEKWDMVEVVCTQPFNKNVQYGLSFVKFHSPPEVEDTESPKPKLQFGNFKIKESEDEETQQLRGTWFHKKNNIDDKLSTSPSAIRQAAHSFAAATLASKESASKSPNSDLGTNIKRKHADDESDLVVQSKKKDSSITHVNREKVGYKNILQKEISTPNTVSKDTKAKPDVLNGKKQSDKKVESKSAATTKPIPKQKPKSRLMEKVVFVLSGFQNPERSMIRDFALEMGAKYKGDWDSSCTHLVCAFINTPKYNQVRSKGGRIVSKKWILDCYKRNELLPWRKYMLGKYTKSSSSEEEEEEEEEEKYEKKQKTPSMNQRPNAFVSISSSNGGASASEKAQTILKPKTPSPVKKTIIPDASEDGSSAESDYKADTDVDSVASGDTEDEIEKVEKAARDRKNSHQNSVQQTPKREKLESGVNRELEMKRPDTTNMPLPELPDFFKAKQFFLYGSFSQKERHDIQRYITAYNGSLADYMSENVKYVVTLSKWNENFDEALLENDNLIFVHPRWIYKCHEKNKLVPYQPHIIVPDE